MGLTVAEQVTNDESLFYSDWDRKLILHEAIKASDQTDKPKGDELWATQKGSVPNSTACNMMVNIARLSAVVIGGGAAGADKDLDEVFYICKEETAVWTKKYITFSEGDSKNNQHLKQASSKESYSVPSYTAFVPTQVKDASDKYINMYYNKYKRANVKLTKAMINIAFSSFKCGLHMTEQDEIDHHFDDVHLSNKLR